MYLQYKVYLEILFLQYIQYNLINHGEAVWNGWYITMYIPCLSSYVQYINWWPTVILTLPSPYISMICRLIIMVLTDKYHTLILNHFLSNILTSTSCVKHTLRIFDTSNIQVTRGQVEYTWWPHNFDCLMLDIIKDCLDTIEEMHHWLPLISIK